MTTKDQEPKIDLVSCTLPDGTWIGQFYTEDYAREWLLARGYDPEACKLTRQKTVFTETKEESK